MKKTALLVMAVLAAFSLAGCAHLAYKTNVETDMVSEKVEMEAAEPAKEEILAEAEVPAEAYDGTAAKTAYAEALENMINNRVFPDGSAVETFGDDDTLENNEFAVFDVDADGEDELVICFTDTYVAAMIEMVFGYDSKTDSLVKELIQFPSITYYNNGTLSAGISHNQGWAGRFWPYTAYKHNPETDTYEEVMFVDAWDGEYTAEWCDEDFPEEVDKDGDLLIYVMNPDWEKGYYSNPVDGDVYEKWADEFFGEKIKIPYVNLTMENIGQIK